jgi:hypothetical protein
LSQRAQDPSDNFPIESLRDAVMGLFSDQKAAKSCG